MSNPNIYGLCCRYKGRSVRIAGRDGRVHFGSITRVSPHQVWLLPSRGPGGFGYGFYGGYGYGYGYPIALAAIAGITLAAAFFW
ncbi:hypothetical protein DXT76_18840 [Halobacillus trueperi]|uniref:Uncharacterized protein n=1 Tax=Halobacillus trueperi TaxID=156205 RepID=A0A3D8VFE1_9BACI|nr:hypothetical protein [Halobacillus trueperi]RDY67989.1 hypothetical protein DXT76_18840 [Halobacillus trueperi]